jgi:uncharacterized OsmC-like protein
MTEKREVNGVNITQIFETIKLIKEQPEIAQFKFRATNKWIDGTHNRAIIKDFYGAGQEDNTRSPIVFEIDEPPILCGNNLGANPVEYLLIALSGCLTTSLIAHSAAKEIEIKGLESRFEGDLDLRGFLGISEDVPVGYQNISVYFKIDADLDESKKKELIEMAKKYSPVFNTITKTVPVSVRLDSE